MQADRLRRLAGGALILLAGCGGGGGGSGSTDTTVPPAGAPMTITSANYTTAATEGANNVNQVAGTGAGAATLVGAETGAAGSTARHALKALSIWRAAGPTDPVLAGAVLTRTIACAVSGSISGSINDVDGNQNFDASGESVTLTFNSCNDGGGETYAGQFSAGLNAALQGDPATTVFRFDLTFAFRNFRVVDAVSDFSANGALRIVASSTSAGNSSVSLSTAAFGASLTFGGVTRSFALHDANYSVVEVGGVSSLTYSGTLTSSLFNGQSVNFQTPTPLRGPSSALYPSSGVIVVTGAGGARSSLTVLNGSQVSLQYDANGDGLAEASVIRNWTDIY